MKLWQKTTDVHELVDRFTVGRDKEFDILLAPFDVLGSIAHVKMLAAVGLLREDEGTALVKELQNIYGHSESKDFSIPAGTEDIHSYIELLLTEKLGDTGKKIHAARSRNDQVLLDIKLFLRQRIEMLTRSVETLFKLLQQKSEQHRNDLLPGYTHMQLAMPSSFGLWFGAYAESLADDMEILQGAYHIVDRNPLGSAAGFGSSFPVNRQMTTNLLGFSAMNHNVVYAQMGRGKAERVTAQALTNLADTLAKMSMDICLYLNGNFDFISFPSSLTTGSSIMPHKKNPDVFELIRGYCNRIKALPNEIMLMTTNLPSGYHRELQLLKENLFPSFEILTHCIELAVLMISEMKVCENITADDKYQYMFSVEEVNRLVLAGLPFRDAYKKVSEDIEQGTFKAVKELKHTHEGSINNLHTAEISEHMKTALAGFNFSKANEALKALLS